MSGLTSTGNKTPAKAYEEERDMIRIVLSFGRSPVRAASAQMKTGDRKNGKNKMSTLSATGVKNLKIFVMIWM